MKIKIELQIEKIEFILQCLSQLPYSKVNFLIEEIKIQTENQITQQEK
jgi:hypothetical protein